MLNHWPKTRTTLEWIGMVSILTQVALTILLALSLLGVTFRLISGNEVKLLLPIFVLFLLMANAIIGAIGFIFSDTVKDKNYLDHIVEHTEYLFLASIVGVAILYSAVIVVCALLIISIPGAIVLLVDDYRDYRNQQRYLKRTKQQRPKRSGNLLFVIAVITVLTTGLVSAYFPNWMQTNLPYALLGSMILTAWTMFEACGIRRYFR